MERRTRLGLSGDLVIGGVDFEVSHVDIWNHCQFRVITAAPISTADYGPFPGKPCLMGLEVGNLV